VPAAPAANPASRPRLLTNTHQAADTGGRGAVWKLDPVERDLDANLIALPPGDGIATHAGPHLDVLIHVVAGSGRLETESDPIDLIPGALVWLPRHSVRGFTAGAEGLRYLTIHRRRQALTLEPPSA
jgi:quercetin dioxygenase-like cupin family protein